MVLPPLCIFQFVILNDPIPLLPKISRCDRHRKEGSVELPSKVDLITLLFNSPLGLGIYNHAFLSSTSPRGVNGDLILPAKNTDIFETDSVDYRLESVWASG